jgi:hypothetical protein
LGQTEKNSVRRDRTSRNAVGVPISCHEHTWPAIIDQFSGAVGADPARLVWCDVNAVETCGFDSPFHDADPLHLADDLRNFSLSFR